MKWLVIITFLFPSLSYSSRNQTLLKCLGEEEKRFHLNKDSGPDYELNQKLISEIIQIPTIDLSEDHLQSICKSKSPSWKLLELSLSEGQQLFTKTKSAELDTSINESMVLDYLESSREIFINLINQIQMISPTPNCLEKQMPEVKSFFRDLKYLENEIGLKKIFNGRVTKIFKTLKKYPVALRKCQEDLKKTKIPSSTSERK